MTTTYKDLTNFFLKEGIADVPHTHKNYLAHVIAVYNDMKRFGADEDLCRAGMYHSVYGTERFQKVAIPLERREEIRQLIGDRAEKFAYWNCFMDRAFFDESVLNDDQTPRFRDRVTGEVIDLSPEDFTELMRLRLCDWLEQVPRTKIWDYRRAGLRRMAERLGGVALESYDRVFAAETATAGADG